MKTQHTPGEWAISRLATPDWAPEFGIYAGDSNRDLARVTGDNAEANATLIAAAPVLLAALTAIVHSADPTGDGWLMIPSRDYVAACDAINQANHTK